MCVVYMHHQAPGTFGFDHEKYRKARERQNTMDEFGRYDEDDMQDGEKDQCMTEKKNSDTGVDTIPTPTPLYTTDLNSSSKRHRETAPPSPAPFSHYAPLAPESAQPESRFDTGALGPANVERVEESAGCCRCVIM